MALDNPYLDDHIKCEVWDDFYDEEETPGEKVHKIPPSPAYEPVQIPPSFPVGLLII